MAQALEIDQFAAFFHAVHDVDPFPWQERLAHEVWATRRWPDLLDLPTGSGKTSVLDIGVFLQALDEAAPPEDRWMPRRIAMVVDRRVVVDQAYQQAKAICGRLQAGDRDPVTQQAAEALRRLWGAGPDDPPCVVGLLRGGIVRDEEWATRPDRPALLASTVDQVGSRILFRGYGLSGSMQPLHAGLLANDTLLLLDEVHLSQAFAGTIDAICQNYRHWGERQLLTRFHVVELSATPRRANSNSRRVPKRAESPRVRFGLDEEDISPVRAPLLRKRLLAEKPVELVIVEVPKTDPIKADQKFALACADRVVDLMAIPHISVAAVVVNRVDTARRIHASLTSRMSDVPVVLLTGRMRPWDRMRLDEALCSSLGVRRDRSKDQPLVVVATQCIEAGADYDFDALVSEAASLDALRQRLGRVDRGGDLVGTKTPSQTVVLARSSSLGDGAEDPIYGTALAATWTWLGEMAVARDGLDLGWASWQEIAPSEVTLSELCAQAPEAPVLFPSHLDSWCQTRPQPAADPDVALWLHGPGREETDVHLVWRQDLPVDLLEEAAEANSDDNSRAHQSLQDIVAFCPPLSAEALPVPIAAARRWLKVDADGMAVVPVADVEGVMEEPEASHRGRIRPVLLWTGGEAKVVSSASKICPGAVIVVPTSYGGLHSATYQGVSYGWWDPEAGSDERLDCAEEMQWRQLSRPVLRLGPWLAEWGEQSPDSSVSESGTTGEGQEDPDLPPIPKPSDLDADDDLTAEGLVASWLRQTDAMGTSEPLGALRSATVSQLQVVVLGGDDADRTDPQSWFGVSLRQLRGGASGANVDLEPETSSFTAVEVSLDQHLAGVGDWAEMLAQHCGLSQELVGDLKLAGRLHDLGKADPRFQAMLRGGRPRLDGEQNLAKSSMPPTGRKRQREARRLSGYPAGTRHEMLSLALIENDEELRRRANDWALVEYLVSSHHGWCRPFAPAVPDPADLDVSVVAEETKLQASTDHGLARLDRGVSDRFWRLVRRYGWWQLAWLEAILRLADHRESEAEQHGKHRG